MPCTTPLNLTITLDDRPPIPLHPLDITAEPLSSSSNPDFCIGLIQPSDAVSQTSRLGDMILGVPFLRNVYTVMSYNIPLPNGTILPYSSESISPRLGLMALTDPTVALDEFHTVRVLNEPLGGSTANTANSSGNTGKKGSSVGIDVLIGVGSFFALCFVLFGLRWILLRRSYRRADAAPGVVTRGDSKRDPGGWGDYQLANRAPEATGLPSEDSLRAARFDAYMRNQRGQSQYTMSSGRTLTGDDGADEEGYQKKQGMDFDDLALPAHVDFPEPAKLIDVAQGGPAPHHRTTSDLLGGTSDPADESSPERSRHDRRPSDRSLSISVPLLPPQNGSEDDVFGFSSSGGMAGVGSVGRGSRVRVDGASGSSPSFSSPRGRSRPYRTPSSGARRSGSSTSPRQNDLGESGP